MDSEKSLYQPSKSNYGSCWWHDFIFEKAEWKRLLLPRFVPEYYLYLPPGSSFESIALVLFSLREEVSDMRKEISGLCESNSRNEKSFEDM